MSNCLYILTKVDTERPKQKLKADRAEKNQGLDGVIREPRQPEDTETINVSKICIALH